MYRHQLVSARDRSKDDTLLSASRVYHMILNGLGRIFSKGGIPLSSARVIELMADDARE